jgi:hypothetical protein
MAAAGARRPIPALIFLLLLSLLAAIVWWRVLHRAQQTGTGRTSSSCAQPSGTAARTVLPAPSKVRVTVLNGNGKSGLAASVSRQLRARGFKIATYGNDDPVAGVGEVRYTAAYAPAATVVHAYFPGAVLVVRSVTPSGVTVSLGAKFKAVATSAQVKVALAKASAAPAPTC